MSGYSTVCENASRRVGESRSWGSGGADKSVRRQEIGQIGRPDFVVAAIRESGGCSSRRWSKEPATAGSAAGSRKRTKGPSGGRGGTLTSVRTALKPRCRQRVRRQIGTGMMELELQIGPYWYL